MKKSYNNPLGVKDYFGKELVLKKDMVTKLLSFFKYYNYQEIETPVFERASIFAKNFYECNNLYTFTNRNAEILALNSDMTKAIARVIAQSNHLSLPIRYVYSTTKYDNKGYLEGINHETKQAGIELIGEKGISADREVLHLAIMSLKKLGIDDFQIHICSTKFLRAFFEDYKINDESSFIISELIKNKDLVSLEKYFQELSFSKEVLSIITNFLIFVADFSKFRMIREIIKTPQCSKVLDEIEEIYNSLGELKKYIMFDFSIASMDSYYTGLYFLGYYKTKEIISGGRYDNLIISNENEALPACGLAINLNTIIDKKIIKYEVEELPVTLIYYDKYTEDLERYLKENKIERVEIALASTLSKAKKYFKNGNYKKLIVVQDNKIVEVECE